MSYKYQVIDFIQKAPFFCIVFLTLICALVLNLSSYFLLNLFDLSDIGFIKERPINNDIDLLDGIDIVLIAPLKETFFMQVLPYYFLTLFTFFKKRKSLVVIISGIIFSLIHYDSFVKMLFAFFLGIIFMSIYILRERKDGFWLVVLIHFLWNGLVVIIKLNGW